MCVQQLHVLRVYVSAVKITKNEQLNCLHLIQIKVHSLITDQFYFDFNKRDIDSTSLINFGFLNISV